ncbi:unnamed protein product, partial [Ectocarpus sp. 8 AP-2014]
MHDCEDPGHEEPAAKSAPTATEGKKTVNEKAPSDTKKPATTSAPTGTKGKEVANGK